MGKKTLAAYLPHLGLAVLLVIFAYLARVLIPVEDSPLPGMSDRELRAHLDRDLEEITRLDTGLRQIVAGLPDTPLPPEARRGPSPEERRWVQRSWPAFVEASRELDALKRKYKGFYQVDYLAKPALHAEAFLTAYSAFVAQYLSSLRLTRRVDRDALLADLLERGDRNGGLPDGTYVGLRRHLTHPDSLVRLSVGRAYLGVVEEELRRRPERVRRLGRDLDEIERILGRHPELFVENPLKRLEEIAFEGWYPDR